jgi:PIN domain nuclease of toxin-antitoxin system
MPSAVLDSSAILAVLNGEPGADAVIPSLATAIASTVNIAEVIGKLIDRGGSLDDAMEALGAIDLDIADYDLDLARRTGSLRTDAANRSLSLGDRACLALAERERVPALTSDRRWSSAVTAADVQFIR